MAMPESAPPASAWAPLRDAAFRNLWIALLASNIGTWMQTVGAQWLLVDAPHAATLVSLVQTASTLPILLLALPAGALADSFDKRRMLIAVQLGLVCVGAMLTALTAADLMPPALLLTLTFALGAGQALTLPAWQAVIPELVPRADLPSASALGGISQNLARAVGPAIAGALIADTGVAAVFALNTLSFAVFAVVLWRWHHPADEDAGEPERFTAAVRAGGRYVRHSPVVQRVLLRSALFVVPGSALWALLPLVASRRLGLGAGGYGVLLGAMGVGAVAGAHVLPRLRRAMSINRMIFAASVLYTVVLVALAAAPWELVVLAVLLPAGAAWVTVMSSINAAMQLFLPAWVRARGLSIYQIVFAAGLGLGALLWGALAQATTLEISYVAAAALMALGAASVPFAPLRDVSGLNRDPAVYWPVPHLELEPHPLTGPVVVTLTYTVSAEREAQFIAAMRAVRRSRMRTGAIRWGLFRSGERPGQFVEMYQVPSWDEHLRQHSDRLTGTDQAIDERARSLADGPPQVTHLLPTS